MKRRRKDALQQMHSDPQRNDSIVENETDGEGPLKKSKTSSSHTIGGSDINADDDGDDTRGKDIVIENKQDAPQTGEKDGERESSTQVERGSSQTEKSIEDFNAEYKRALFEMSALNRRKKIFEASLKSVTESLGAAQRNYREKKLALEQETTRRRDRGDFGPSPLLELAAEMLYKILVDSLKPHELYSVRRTCKMFNALAVEKPEKMAIAAAKRWGDLFKYSYKRTSRGMPNDLDTILWGLLHAYFMGQRSAPNIKLLRSAYATQIFLGGAGGGGGGGGGGGKGRTGTFKSPLLKIRTNFYDSKTIEFHKTKHFFRLRPDHYETMVLVAKTVCMISGYGGVTETRRHHKQKILLKNPTHEKD
jgi:hypothetical protein